VSAVPTGLVAWVSSGLALVVLASSQGGAASLAGQPVEATLLGEVPPLATRSQVKQLLGRADERLELARAPRAVEQWLYRRPDGAHLGSCLHECRNGAEGPRL
jgi:hypothetical protein